MAHDAGKFRWLLKRRRVSTSKELAVNQIVVDAVDAEEGTSAPPSWGFMYSVQTTFF